jgi:hypothetical protein
MARVDEDERGIFVNFDEEFSFDASLEDRWKKNEDQLEDVFIEICRAKSISKSVRLLSMNASCNIYGMCMLSTPNPVQDYVPVSDKEKFRKTIEDLANGKDTEDGIMIFDYLRGQLISACNDVQRDITLKASEMGTGRRVLSQWTAKYDDRVRAGYHLIVDKMDGSIVEVGLTKYVKGEGKRLYPTLVEKKVKSDSSA